MRSVSGTPQGVQDVTMLDDRWMTSVGAQERESEPFGMNMITRAQVFSYREGIARFFLPGYAKAASVYLAGSFNAFSTTNAPMARTDSGWIAQVRLKPGKYLYKYIIDGRWTPDPFNRLREDDTYGDFNSVVFCYNHYFYLRGFNGAKDITVTGSFNGWDPEMLHLQRVSGGWIRGLYLREGTHSYKFVVDGRWILDPANPVVRPDGYGNENSAVSIGTPTLFRLKGYTDAKKVVLTGTFNGWNREELLMQKVEGGWELGYVLRPGNYEYKFIRDGKWMTDPDNPNKTGTGAFANSVVTVNPNYTFTLAGHQEAHVVLIAGSFNGWNPGAYPMTKQDGKWTIKVYLQPGKHTYKFIVDGKWILDPANKLWEQNQYGTGNSVLWIEP
jgi:hypothetical protein